MTNVICLYHANCLDGIAAAWVVRQDYLERRIDVQCIPVSYNSPPPIDKIPDDSIVYVVDFSYPPHELDMLSVIASKIHVIDHHETAIRKLEGYQNNKVILYLNKEVSGAVLTWEYLYQNEEVPYWITAIGDRDIWKFAYADTKAICRYISHRKLTFDWLDQIHNVIPYEEVYEIGYEMQVDAEARYQDIIDGFSYRARFLDYEDIPMLNLQPSVDISEILNLMADGNPFSVGWCRKGRDKYIYSLRSVKGAVNVAELLEPHGGGGHANAAGLTVKATSQQPINFYIGS